METIATKVTVIGKTIWFGVHVWEEFTFYSDAYMLMFDLAKHLDIDPGLLYTPAAFHKFEKIHGISAFRLVRIINAIMLSVWKVDPWHNKYAFTNSNKPVSICVHRIHKVLPWLEQTVADGNTNIAPFIFGFGLPTTKLREMFGQSLWRRLCKNTETRNKLILCRTTNYRMVVQPLEAIDKGYKEVLVRRVRNISTLPTTLLKRGLPSYLYDDVRAVYAALHLNPVYKNALYFLGTQLASVISDTLIMADQLGKKVRLDSTPEVWVGKHEQFIRKLSKQEGQNTNSILPKFEIEQDGYTLRLITSEYEAHVEGRLLNHCVASYWPKVCANMYRIYSIRKDTFAATIGVVLDNQSKTTKLDQIRGYSNQLVEIPNSIIEFLCGKTYD